MQIKVNKDVRKYTESIYFGLSLRQFLFSLAAVGIAILIYFIVNPYFNLEVTSWFCIFSALPFALLGFINYHGMTAEQLLITFIRSEILMPTKLLFRSTNTYKSLIKKEKNKNDYSAKKNTAN